MDTGHLRPDAPIKPVRPSKFASRPETKHPQSSKNAYIVFFGTSECDKADTINMLFGCRQIAEMSLNIKMYSTHIEGEKNIKIVDVPSLGEGEEMDAKIIATLRKFMDVEDELVRCIPHVVVIVTRYDDPNWILEGGRFVKALKSIDLLNKRLLDNISCNVIVVMSRLMSGSLAEVTYRNDQLLNMVRKYTKFPQMPYMVLAENEGWKHQLNNNGIACVLPNHEIYPNNLIENILKVSAGSVPGAVGPNFLKQVFQNRAQVSVWRSINMPLVDVEGNRFKKCYSLVKQSYQSKT